MNEIDWIESCILIVFWFLSAIILIYFIKEKLGALEIEFISIISTCGMWIFIETIKTRSILK